MLAGSGNVEPEVAGASVFTRSRLGCAVVVVVVVACYTNALRGGFVFDDRTLVLDNPTLRSFRFIPQIVTTNLWAFIGRSTNYYRPVPPLLLMLVYSAFGPRPGAFHAVSLLLHVSSACLVFGIARTLLRSRARGDDPVWAAVLAGLLFGVHPVNTESVAWISGIVDAVGTLFSVLAIWAHVTADASGSPWRRRALSWCALLLALLSKESAVAIPPVLVAYDLASRREQVAGPGQAVKRWGPLLVACAVYLAARGLVLGGLSPARYGPAGSLADGAILLSRYLEKLALPVHLSVVPEIPLVGTLGFTDVLRAVVVLAAASALAVVLWRRGGALRMSLLLMLLPIAPALYAQVLNRPELLANRFAERHLYLSTVGWAIAMASVALSVGRRSAALRRAVVLSAAAVVVLFATGTAARNRVWRDEVALWTDAVEKSPGVPEAHFKLGIALLRRGEVATAERALQAGARLDHAFIQQLFARGMDAERAGNHQRALAELEVVSLALPKLAEARFWQGEALAAMGDADAALRRYVETLNLDPYHVQAARRAARLLRERGRPVDSLRVLETAARNSPGDAGIRADLDDARRTTDPGGAPPPSGRP